MNWLWSSVVRYADYGSLLALRGTDHTLNNICAKSLAQCLDWENLLARRDPDDRVLQWIVRCARSSR